MGVHLNVFAHLVRNTVKSHGMPSARQVFVPTPLMNTPPAVLRQYVEGDDLATALRWTGRRLPLLLAGVAAIPGLLLVTGPMILADLATRNRKTDEAGRASRHLYFGSAVVLVWWALLAALAGIVAGAPAALLAVVALPVAGFAGLAVQHAWSWRLHQARRWLFLRFGGRWRRRLQAQQAALGARLEVIEEVLGHASGSRAGIVGVYQRHRFEKEKRAALESWSQVIQTLLEAEPTRKGTLP